jgi:hypothetical protein
LGVDEYAWTEDYVLKTIQFCQNKRLAILGGDVLEQGTNGIRYTFDNWYIEQDSNSWSDYVTLSCKFAVKKILYFSTRFPDKQLLFTLVVSKE